MLYEIFFSPNGQPLDTTNERQKIENGFCELDIHEIKGLRMLISFIDTRLMQHYVNSSHFFFLHLRVHLTIVYDPRGPYHLL